MSSEEQEVRDAIGLGDARPRRRKGLWIALGVIAAIAAAVVVRVQLRSHETPTYVTEPAHEGPLKVTVTATGTLQPTHEVDVGSEVSGLIDKVFVDFNDTVKAGQVIAQLDTRTLEARVASARASLQQATASQMQAEATVTETEAKAKRSRELAQRNIASQQTLESDEASAQRAVAAVASAKAQVTAAQAALQEAETALKKAVIHAPIDGMVIAREVDPGQTVAATFQTPVLFKLAEDLRHMELHLDLDESDVGEVHEGQRAEFRVDAYPGKMFDAEITSVHFDPHEVNNVVTYETVLSVKNPDLLLRPGMTATADILVAEKPSALLVPNRALRFLPSEAAAEAAKEAPPGPRVWVVRSGAAKPLAVSTGLTNGEFTEILGGDVAVGTPVIVDIERTARPRPSGNGPFG